MTAIPDTPMVSIPLARAQEMRAEIDALNALLRDVAEAWNDYTTKPANGHYQHALYQQMKVLEPWLSGSTSEGQL